MAKKKQAKLPNAGHAKDNLKIFKENVADCMKRSNGEISRETGDRGFDRYVFSGVLDPTSAMDISLSAMGKIADHLDKPLWQLLKPKAKLKK